MPQTPIPYTLNPKPDTLDPKPLRTTWAPFKGGLRGPGHEPSNLQSPLLRGFWGLGWFWLLGCLDFVFRV